MANQLLTSQVITFDSLMILENDLVVIPAMWSGLDDEFGKEGNKIGDTVYQRKPNRWLGRDGQAYQPEGITDTQTPLTINQQSGVDFEFSTAERKLSIDDFRRRILDTAVASLANKLDVRAITVALQNTGNQVGTPGTTPGLSSSDAFLIYAQAGQKLDELGFPYKGPNSKRVMVINSAMKTGWTDFFKGIYNPQNAVTEQYKTGQVSNALGYQWFVDQNIQSQTIGLLGGTPAVVAANQTGTSINTNGWTASITGVLNIGDTISFAGVDAVNPQSRQSTGALMQFSVQAQASSDGAGASTLTIYPALVPSGQFQNVTNSPAAGALISVYGVAAAGQSALSGLVSPQALLLAEQSYAFASFPGEVPDGTDMAFQQRSKQLKLSLRFVRVFDAFRDQWVSRFDVYYGIAPMYPEGACRVAA